MNGPGRDVVLIGVDGTEAADRAVRYGVQEAQREHRSIRLVHVVHEAVPLNPMLPLFGSDTLRAVGTRILADAEARVRQLADEPVHVEQVLARGPRASAILVHAQDAAVVVLGTRPSTMEHIWTGSTTTGVAARAHCPVISVPEEWLTAPVHRRVVAAVDGSPASADVLRAAFAEAHDRGAQLVVVHAWRPSGQYDVAIGARVGAEAWERQTEPAVWALVAGWRADFPDVAVEVCLKYQNVAVALAEASRQADLLVMGRRGERAPFGLSLGSRARTMIRVGACPVEIVPVPQAEHGEIPKQAAGREVPDSSRST
jgi:nucleotide-binding universal stress UspA family protein